MSERPVAILHDITPESVVEETQKIIKESKSGVTSASESLFLQSIATASKLSEAYSALNKLKQAENVFLKTQALHLISLPGKIYNKWNSIWSAFY